MKAALIPPNNSLPLFGRGSFHLLLSHLLKNKVYYKHYEEQRERGAYLVLDNSAHEFGVGDDPEALIFNALALRAQEVVVPDVLDDSAATLDRAVDALELWFESKYLVINREMPALMYVPQGANVAEWVVCLNSLLDLHRYVTKKSQYRSDVVIGISKDYEVWDGGIERLLTNYVEPLRQQHKNIHVHLLGWGRELWALGWLATKFPWLRSTDSAKPFVYALNGLELDVQYAPPAYPGRSDNYFRRRMNNEQIALSQKNVAVFRELAAGTAREATGYEQ